MLWPITYVIHPDVATHLTHDHRLATIARVHMPERNEQALGKAQTNEHGIKSLISGRIIIEQCSI
jgi:hypothetical protein